MKPCRCVSRASRIPCDTSWRIFGLSIVTRISAFLLCCAISTVVACEAIIEFSVLCAISTAVVLSLSVVLNVPMMHDER